MNIAAFAALKVGDKIENAMMQSHGTVAKTDANGVHLTWGDGTMLWFYSVNSSAWMHWEKVETE